MIFLTVGTLFPFDRLVRAVDDAVTSGVVGQPVFAQIGRTSYTPRNIDFTESLDRDAFDKKAADADYLISHAGMGTITMALELNKPLLVMARRKKFKEHVNDHQVATARKFEELGHILVAYTEDEIPEKIEKLKLFVPKPRKNQTIAVIDRINKFIDELKETKY